MRQVTKCKLFILLPFILLAICFFLAIIIFPSRPTYYFLTFWTFWGNLVYLLITHFCDWALCIFKTQRFETLCTFMRDKYSRISFTFSYAVVFLYWNLFLLGDKFISTTMGLIPTISHIYFHGGITFTLLLDFILYEHKDIEWNRTELIIITSIMIVYGMVVGYAKYFKGFITYKFMENASLSQLLVCFFIFFIILLNAFQLHLLLLKYKNKKKEHTNPSEGVVTVELADVPETPIS